MKPNEHTPTPWMIEGLPGEIRYGSGFAKEFIGKCHSPNEVENAAFIVLAANLFDALMDEHKTGECFCDPDGRKGLGPCEWCIVEAIAKAEGH